MRYDEIHSWISVIFFSNWRHKPAIVPNVSHFPYPMCSVYGIFTNIYPINHPNVGKYTLDGSYGYVNTNVLLNVLLILVVPLGLLQLQYFDYRESTFLKKRKKKRAPDRPGHASHFLVWGSIQYRSGDQSQSLPGSGCAAVLWSWSRWR